MSAPPGAADRDRWARLLAAAEVARRGGTAREVSRGGGPPRLLVAAPDGSQAAVRVSTRPAPAGRTTGLRIVVEAGAGGVAFFVVPADADAADGVEPWRGRWELLGL